MRVVVAMSGGVDSSTAALLLRNQGHEVTGVFLRQGATSQAPSAARQGCCSASDAADAAEVAGLLGIPFYALDAAAGFAGIVEHFVAEYAAGRTPNPCVQCNRQVKFGELFDFARALGASHVATGHYARCEPADEGVVLRRAVDRGKDQSYVLGTVPGRVLRRALFPLGKLPKDEVRALACAAGLPVHDKAESQEICFVPSGDYRDLLAERRPELFRAGAVVDSAGAVLGEHGGAAGFTVGQRRGLRLAGGGRRYVLETDPARNRVVVGRREELLRRRCELIGVNWLGPREECGVQQVTVQIRAHHGGWPATLSWEGPDRAAVEFEPPGEVVSPGQVGAAYSGDVLRMAGTLAHAPAGAASGEGT